MVDAIIETANKAVIGGKRMALQMWCVCAIVVIEYMHMVMEKDSSYCTLSSVLLIAALGGVDAWKQSFIEKPK